METLTKSSILSFFLLTLLSSHAFAGHLEPIKSQIYDKKTTTSKNNEQSFAKLLKETDPKIINALENVTLEMHGRFMPSEIALMIGAFSLLATIGAGIFGSKLAQGSQFNIVTGFSFALIAGLAGGAVTVSTYGLLKMLELYKRRKFAKKFAKMISQKDKI